MSYININEYDYTTSGPKTHSGNVVAIPINASDGPSDKWVTVHTYDEFIQTFGNNPDAAEANGNSWEYAANLLLRGMSVCVRRITHTLNEDGENTNVLLPNVQTAKAVIKIKDIINGDEINNSFDVGNIVVTDVAKHSVLKKSIEGELISNPLYLSNGIREDGSPIELPHPTVFALETYTEELIANGKEPLPTSFADVSSTNSEWNYIGEQNNTHYKYQTFGEPTAFADILKMNQLENEFDNNKPFILGDFFIAENNHVVIFSPTGIMNDFWIRGQKQYPSELKEIDEDNLKSKCFVDVTYNEKNNTVINHVWVYSETGTVVSNHKFVNGTEKVTDAKYKVFKTDKNLPKTNVGIGYFAAVQSTNTIYEYNGEKWEDTGVKIESLATVDSKYAMEVRIPFECTGKAIDTDIYKHYFNWINTETDYYIDDKNPELVFTKKIHWKNSSNPIGTRNHKIVSGTKMYLNDVIINTDVDVSKSKLTLYVNDYKDISIDTDYTDNKAISGTYGLANDGNETLRIYSFALVQKMDNGFENTIYNAKIENIKDYLGTIVTDPLLKIYDTTIGRNVNDPKPKYDETAGIEKWYIELQPGQIIYYDKELSNAKFSFKVASFHDIRINCQVLKSNAGYYNINLLSDVNSSELEKYVAKVSKYYLSEKQNDNIIDYTNIPKKDSYGYFNLFTAEYAYPGKNGNDLSISLKTIANQGIYVYVYRQTQLLEKIELCSFRYRNGSTGRIMTIDMELKKDEVWKAILSNFGVYFKDNDNTPYGRYWEDIDSNYNFSFIYGNYIKIGVNKNIIFTDPSSLIYIDSLYRQNGDIKIPLQNGNNPDNDHVMHEVHKCYKPLIDKYRYDIKFVTNGGFIDKITYPNMSSNVFGVSGDEDRLIEDAMIELATTRKDCVAFLDVPYDLQLEDIPRYFEHISTSYAAAYSPWAQTILGTGSVKWMPPSFVQLYTHAKSIQSGNKLYLPPAGVKRAQVPEIIRTNHDLTSKYLTLWQDHNTSQFINPIIWINGFDFTVFGQKTLFNIVNESDKYQSALQDLNVRLVANEIKKLIFKTCIELTFELNNILTWNEFKSKIEPTLSVMQGEGVLYDYDVVMGTETMTAADLNSGHIVGTVRISVARAVTDWDINFELTPYGATFSEYDYNSMYNE